MVSLLTGRRGSWLPDPGDEHMVRCLRIELARGRSALISRLELTVRKAASDGGRELEAVPAAVLEPPAITLSQSPRVRGISEKCYHCHFVPSQTFFGIYYMRLSPTQRC